MDVPSARKEKWPETQIYASPLTEADVWLDSQGFGKNKKGNWWQELQRRGVRRVLECKDLCVLRECSAGTSTAKAALKLRAQDELCHDVSEPLIQIRSWQQRWQ